MKYCSMCGSQCANNAKFCEKCGHEFTAVQSTLKPQQESINLATYNTTPVKESRVGVLVLLAILIVEFIFDARALGEATVQALICVLIAGGAMRAFRVTFRGPISKAWRPFGIVLAIQWLVVFVNSATQKLNDDVQSDYGTFAIFLTPLAVSIIVLWM